MGFDMGTIQRNLFLRLRRRRRRREYPPPNSAFAPAGEAIVDHLEGPYSFGRSIQRQPTFSTCMFPLKPVDHPCAGIPVEPPADAARPAPVARRRTKNKSASIG